MKLANRDHSPWLLVESKNKLFAKLSYPQSPIAKDHRKHFYIQIESLVLSCLMKISFHCSDASDCVMNLFHLNRCKTFSVKTDYKDGNLNFFIYYDVDMIKDGKYKIYSANKHLKPGEILPNTDKVPVLCTVGYVTVKDKMIKS